MKIDTHLFINGILAGLMSAAIVLCSAINLQFSFISFLTPLPIFVAGFMFGTMSSIVASAAATLLIYFIAPILTGFMMPDLGNMDGQANLTPLLSHSLVLSIIIQSFVPAILGSYLAGLAKPLIDNQNSKQLIWFSISDILFLFALWIACSHAIAWNIILPPELFTAENWAVTINQRLAELPLQKDETERAQLAMTLLGLLPLFLAHIIGFSGFIVLTGNLYLSLLISRRLKSLKRPRELWPLHLRMSRNSLYALLLMVVLLSFLPMNSLAAIFACLAIGALSAGFMLSGLAMMHAKLPASPFRSLFLVIFYFVSISLQFPLLIFIIVGLFDTRRRITISNISIQES